MDEIYSIREVSRITCVVHQRLSARLADFLRTAGVNTVFARNGRSVRHFVKKRPLFIPGSSVSLQDSSSDIFQFTLPRRFCENMMSGVVEECGLEEGGRGTIYSQDMVMYGGYEPNIPDIKEYTEPHFHDDLACITAILSMRGSADVCARLALELGTCVPVITHGHGTGMRDKLGLLRITIPPEKELITLLAPQHDADGIIRMLVEGAKLDKPGRGIIYRTTVASGLTDTRIHIGHQKYAASMEQIIAALDKLHFGTSWRHRFADNENLRWSHQLVSGNKEVNVVCPEGVVKNLTGIAMENGAGGATTSILRRTAISDNVPGAAAYEQSTLIIDSQKADYVIKALLASKEFKKAAGSFITVTDAPAAFTYR
ncbi:MAG: hypothetical protein JXR90_00910 [Spirochaetes bacterium]|nr:hypothetical protein [Spirochaetota bacterium]